MNEKYGSLIPKSKVFDGKRRKILFDSTKCIGCRQCIHACKDWHDHRRTSVYELSATNWITIEPPVLEGLSSLWARNSCMHCEFPMCAAVCPVEAITKYEEGPVGINEKTCIGCEYCIYACPWGVITKSDVTHKVGKCTMCIDLVGEDKSPFCVQTCPAGALEFGLEEGISAEASKRAHENGGCLYGDKEAGGTQLLYVLKEKNVDYGLRPVGLERYPKHKIPVGLMIKDLFTLRCGFKGKIRALYLAIIHPRRVIYRYWP